MKKIRGQVPNINRSVFYNKVTEKLNQKSQ